MRPWRHRGAGGDGESKRGRHGRRWRHGPPRSWRFWRGIHRRLLSLLFLAVGLGGFGGWVMHGAEGSTVVKLAVLGLVAAWVLAWVATRRIAWPVRELARVAADLHGGRLASRDQLPVESAELGDLSRSLRGMAERMERQLDDQRALMAAVSHELRSPLGRARVLVELAREGHAGPEGFDELQSEIDAMDDLVGDLLAAARIDFSAVSPVPLGSVEAARLALAQDGLPETLLQVEGLQGEGATGVIEADATLLARALHLLLENGAGHGGGVVALQVQVRGDVVRFAVEDDGPGFQPGEEDQAFEPFWRGRGPRPSGEGLGLALVRRIAEVHGGQAGAENREEGGARAWMEVPLA